MNAVVRYEELPALVDILEGYEGQEPAFRVDNRELLDAILVEDLLCISQ